MRKNNIFILLLCIFFLPLFPNAETKYLYDVLKEEAETGGLAREYTGEHHDSFTEEPSQKIYHWHAANNTQGTQIQNKNNVIFADHCWQMIRTTDTGGVKLLYNGEVVRGKCLNSRPDHFGYELGFLSSSSMHSDSEYIYSTSYSYDSNSKEYILSGDTFTSDYKLENINKLVNHYTCMRAFQTRCSDLRYIERETYPGKAYYLIYNNSTPYSSIGKSPFNLSSDGVQNALTNSGYMRNHNFSSESQEIVSKQEVLIQMSYSQGTPYSSTVEYDYNRQMYNLVDANTDSLGSNLTSLRGKYVFACYNCTASSKALYIEGTYGSYYYVLIMENGKTAETYDDFINVADNIIKKENGMYELDPETTISIPYLQWYQKYYLAAGKYTCLSQETQCEEPYKITRSYDTDFYYVPNIQNYLFGSDYNYDETTNKYVLSGDIITNAEYLDNTSLMNTHHFTCLSTENNGCSELLVVHNVSSSQKIYYQTIKNGESFDEKLNKMLNSNQTNQEESDAKELIDYWYKENLISKEKYLEETIFCNDRSIADLAGWDTNGGSVWKNLKYNGSNSTKDLSCGRVYDKFSIYNNNAKLSYSIGMLTRPEVELNGSSSLNSGISYWLMTPESYNYANGNKINYISNGSLSQTYNFLDINVRPVISLKNNSSYSSGDGTNANPYVIDGVVKSNITVVNDQSIGTYSINMTDKVEEGSIVKLQVSPNSGYEVSNITITENGTNNSVNYETNNGKYQFSMPAKNITITIEYEKANYSISDETNNPNTGNKIIIITILIILILGITTYLYKQKESKK